MKKHCKYAGMPSMCAFCHDRDDRCEKYDRKFLLRTIVTQKSLPHVSTVRSTFRAIVAKIDFQRGIHALLMGRGAKKNTNVLE